MCKSLSHDFSLYWNLYVYPIIVFDVTHGHLIMVGYYVSVLVSNGWFSSWNIMFILHLQNNIWYHYQWCQVIPPFDLFSAIVLGLLQSFQTDLLINSNLTTDFQIVASSNWFKFPGAATRQYGTLRSVN